jgi:hypothetical protein
MFPRTSKLNLPRCFPSYAAFPRSEYHQRVRFPDFHLRRCLPQVGPRRPPDLSHALHPAQRLCSVLALFEPLMKLLEYFYRQQRICVIKQLSVPARCTSHEYDVR